MLKIWDLGSDSRRTWSGHPWLENTHTPTHKSAAGIGSPQLRCVSTVSLSMSLKAVPPPDCICSCEDLVLRLKSSWWRSADITLIFPTQLSASHTGSSADSNTLRPHFSFRSTRSLCPRRTATHNPPRATCTHCGPADDFDSSCHQRGPQRREVLAQNRREREAETWLISTQAFWTELQVSCLIGGGIIRRPFAPHSAVVDIYVHLVSCLEEWQEITQRAGRSLRWETVCWW